MLYIFSLMLAMSVPGFAAGILWRWRSLYLLLLCAVGGFSLCFVFRRASLLGLILKEGGSAAGDCLFNFSIYFLVCILPVVVGGVAGFVVRQKFPKAFRQ